MGQPGVNALLAVAILLFVGSVAALSKGETEFEILERLLQHYNPKIRPPAINGTGTIVTINSFVRDFEYIDDAKMEYGVQLTFRQQWVDQRLIFIPPASGLRYLTLKETNRIWIPDTFFSNEKSGNVHNLLTPNLHVRIYPDGEVLYSVRVSLKLSCPMEFRNFPFDRQSCTMRTASFSYTQEDIIYKWKEEDPVQVTTQLHLPYYYLKKFETGTCDAQTNTGIYSCLRVDFVFQRGFYYYLIQVFIPTTSLVIMSGLSLWLDKSQVVARLLLSLMSYLIMILGIVILNFTLPKVSYTKAMDVWTGVCLTFVSVSIWELIVVHFLHRAEEKQEEQNRQLTGRRETIGQENHHGKENEDLIVTIKRKRIADKIDIFARIFYPLAFLVFTGTFLAVYGCNHKN
jgi:anionic glutamate receptor